MKEGTCTKCGKFGKIAMHHTKGYEGIHKDEVYPYCWSCHTKIHKEARKSGRCMIPPKQIIKLSTNSTTRRWQKERCKHICFETSLIPNVRLTEIIHVHPAGIIFGAYFQATNGKRLYEVDI